MGDRRPVPAMPARGLYQVPDAEILKPEIGERRELAASRPRPLHFWGHHSFWHGANDKTTEIGMAYAFNTLWEAQG
jgi:hypothetical protein